MHRSVANYISSKTFLNSALKRMRFKLIREAASTMPKQTIQQAAESGPLNCGDFVDSLYVGVVQSQAEPAFKYLEGHYCPLWIGLILESDSGTGFRIEHKLGHGGFSTVWLARNLSNNRLVAIKVISSGWREDHERQVKEIIQNAGENVSSYFVTYETSFSIFGSNNKRYCVLVLPWRGPNITTCFGLPVSLRIPAARNLLMALKYLHATGVIHSDLNATNVLWDIKPGSDRWSTTEVSQHLGRPRKVLLPKKMGKGELVEPTDFPEEMLRPKLYLGGFGHSIMPGTKPKDPLEVQLMYCAPERLHGIEQSFASDIWSFTFIFAQLYIGIEIAHGNDSTFVSRLVGALGPFPAHWKGQYIGEEDDWWYDQTYKTDSSYYDLETLEDRIDRMRPDITAEERRLALDVIRKGLQYLPEKRITAAELLEDPSFNTLMDYYKT